MEVDGREIFMELDNGSSISLIPNAVFTRMWHDTKLSQCQYWLRF